MWLYTYRDLFKPDYMSIATYDDIDAIIVPRDCFDMLRKFFTCSRRNWSFKLGVMHNHCSMKDGVWSYDGVELVRDVEKVEGLSAVALKERYYLIVFKLEEHYRSGLLVVRCKDYSFVGFISSRYGTTSTAELSRLILSTPEIDWNI